MHITTLKSDYSNEKGPGEHLDQLFQIKEALLLHHARSYMKKTKSGPIIVIQDKASLLV